MKSNHEITLLEVNPIENKKKNQNKFKSAIMKSLIASLSLIFVTTLSFSQTNNTLPTTGKVGIGTVSPSAKLDVNGNVIIDSCLIVKDSVHIQKNLRVSQDVKIAGKLVIVDNSVAKNNFKVLGNFKLPNAQLASGMANKDMLFINANGKVFKGGYDNLIEILHEEKGCSPSYLTNPYWMNGPSKLFTACPEVKVGIGINSPLYKLDVRGNGYFSGGMGIGIEPLLTDVQLNIKTLFSREVGICVDQLVSVPYSYAYKAIVHDAQTKGFGIYNDQYGKDVFTVYGDGKIEVSNATGKIWQLESNGLMRGRKIKLDLDTWADYVFDNDYVLMSLKEVEEFIEEEKHLPNVPSEAEIMNDGVDLGEMNIVLLEKVEELTLYLIEQSKAIESQQSELNELKQELSEIKLKN